MLTALVERGGFLLGFLQVGRTGWWEVVVRVVLDGVLVRGGVGVEGGIGGYRGWLD